MNSLKPIFLLAILYLVCCNNAHVNQPTSQDYTYTPLHVGDIRQFIDEQDSFATDYAIIGKTLRKDGREVFIQVYTYGEYSDTFYLFLQDGFYIFSALDTPFVEQKNCREKPTNGYSWKDDRNFCRYTYINKYTTFAGEFCETFLLERSDYELFLRNYYGKNIGLIGAEFIDSSGVAYGRSLLSYAKIDGKEYGHLFPSQNLATSKALLKTKSPLAWAIDGRIIPNAIRKSYVVAK